MSRRTKFLLGLFAVVVVVDALFVFGSLRGCSAGEGEPRTGARLPPADGGTPRAPSDEPTRAALEPDRVAEPAASTDRAEREVATASEHGFTLPGRVEFPPGTPAEEGMQVVCGAFDADAGDPIRSPVARDGSFRARFPGQRTGWIGLDARWLLLEMDENIDLRDPPREIVLRPRLGACVTGRIVLPKGFEVERTQFGVEDLELMRSTDDAALYAVRDKLRLSNEPELVLTSRALDPDGETRLAILNSRFVAAVVPLELAPGVESRVTVQLELGMRVRGRVVDTRGAPIEAAFVHADPSGGTSTGRGLFQTRSGPDGRYELCIGAKGFLRAVVIATKDGFVTERRDLAGRESGAFVDAPELVTERDDLAGLENGAFVDAPDFVLASDRIAGRVFGPEGTPAREVRIEAFVEAASVHESVRTRARGASSAYVESGPDGEFVVHVSATGLHRIVASGAPGVATLAGVAPGTEALELRLAPVAPFVVEVRDDTGRPYVGVSIVVFPAPYTEARPFAKKALTTDASGRTWIEALPDGPWTIEASYGALLERVTIDLRAPSGSKREQRFTFPRAASLSGSVLDANRDPARGVHVRLEPVIRTEGSFAHRTPGARTDESGGYTINGIAPGRYRLVSMARGFEVDHLELELAPGEVRSNVDIDLSRTATIEVEVVDADGRHEVGRDVRCRVERTGYALSASTDAKGRARFEYLPHGRVWLERVAIGFDEIPRAGARPVEPMTGRARLELMLAPGEERRVVLGGPIGAAVRLRGRIVLGSRRGAGVGVLAVDGCAGPHVVHAGVDGLFEVDVHDGSTTVVRFDLGGQILERTVGAEEALRGEITFELPAGELRGVLRALDGRPIPEVGVAVVRASSTGGMVLDARVLACTVSSDGRFTLPFLEPGRYQVVVSGIRARPREVEIPADGDPVEIEIVVP